MTAACLTALSLPQAETTPAMAVHGDGRVALPVIVVPLAVPDHAVLRLARAPVLALLLPR